MYANKNVVVVTGASKGIGQAIALKFLNIGCIVHGIDIIEPQVFNMSLNLDSGRYYHHIADVSEFESLPDIPRVDILINNAGQQTPTSELSTKDIDVNLKGVINCTYKYALHDHPEIQSILNIASVSAHNGAEFPEYVASKGGVLAYTVWTAKELANKSVTVNSLSLGGVTTDLNRNVMNDPTSWNQILEETPMRKWMSTEEVADWVYFMTVINTSCTGQDIIIDNGEMINHKFIWR